MQGTLVLIKPPSYYKVSQIFLVDHFLYRYMIAVAGVERKPPWDLIPSTKLFAPYL